MEMFDSISPLDFRYYGADKHVFASLNEYLSENASIRYMAKVESALVQTLAEKNFCSKKIAHEIEQACDVVTPTEVYEEEKRIKHNVRALVNQIRNKVSDEAKPYVHFTATSNDIISTSEALRLKDSVIKALIPELIELEKTLIELADREKNTVQIGRTHGQHAEPITFGFTIASYVARLGRRIEKLKEAALDLRGKFSGPVGAYNGISLFEKKPEDFEKAILSKLGLKPGEHSTQLVEVEYTTDVMHYAISTLGVLANIADDMRHLQRSEISEIYEDFEVNQVGSSTMPHKRNPINFENVKSMWKEFMPRMNTAYMDQISEHQRDLTNSASSRFNPEIIVGVFASSSRLNKTLKKIKVDKESLKRNFETNKHIPAEPLYLLLASLGHPDAHEAIRKLTLNATGKNLMEAANEDEELKPYLGRIRPEMKEILKNPENYIGKSSSRTAAICKNWREKLKI